MLVRVLAREGIASAWVGHLPSAFWRDPTPGNAALYEALAPYPALRPAPAIRPDWPGWERQLRDAVERDAPAVRVHPTLWAMGAGDPSLARLADGCAESGRVLSLTVRFEDGRQRRDFVHVRDVAGANLAALAWTADREAGSFRAFNVGSGTVHTIGEMAEALAREAGGSAPVTTGEYRLGDVRHITASSERLRRELGWEPRMTFEEGMREFATAPLRAAVGG